MQIHKWDDIERAKELARAVMTMSDPERCEALLAAIEASWRDGYEQGAATGRTAGACEEPQGALAGSDVAFSDTISPASPSEDHLDPNKRMDGADTTDLGLDVAKVRRVRTFLRKLDAQYGPVPRDIRREVETLPWTE